MNPLHPRITVTWRIAGLIAAALLTSGARAVELFVILPSDQLPIAEGILSGGIAILAFGLALVWPALRYRAWRWRVDEDRVEIRKGVIWRSHSLMPRVRIQHVETRSSPLQRRLGLASLVIYTAGTRGADESIPGLAAGEAERLREDLARLEELEHEEE